MNIDGVGDYESIKVALLGLKTSDEVVVVERGACFLDQTDWFNLLQHSFGFTADVRHFDANLSLKSSQWWEISYQPELSSSYAYSNTEQPLHCDNAWFSDPAEINFFIMKKQASAGGAQVFYPAFRLVDDLQREAPILLDSLKSVPVRIQKGSSEEHFNFTTILKLDDNLIRVFWNYYRTEKEQSEVNEMCESFFRFLKGKQGSTSLQRIYLQSGDCLAFNDSLVLHGRDAFQAVNPFDRVLLQSMWNVPV
jgi:alpha-ketoglutarate-dependent taurine dioxygenase